MGVKCQVNRTSERCFTIKRESYTHATTPLPKSLDESTCKLHPHEKRHSACQLPTASVYNRPLPPSTRYNFQRLFCNICSCRALILKVLLPFGAFIHAFTHWCITLHPRASPMDGITNECTWKVHASTVQWSKSSPPQSTSYGRHQHAMRMTSARIVHINSVFSDGSLGFFVKIGGVEEWFRRNAANI